MICYRCHEPVGGPVCVGCGALQPPPAQADHFAILGLQRAYHIDPEAVDAAHRELSRKVHPDRFAGKSAVERRMSLQWTAAVNEARRVLKDPTARAWYLAAGTPAPPDDGKIPLDPDFLEEIFDLRMAAAEDPDATRARAQELYDANQGWLQTTFTRWEAGQGDLAGVDERLARIKYLQGLL